MTTCPSFKRKVTLRKAFRPPQVPKENKPQEQKSVAPVKDTTPKMDVITLKDLLKDQQQQLQLFIIAQQEKLKDIVKSELKEEFSREMQRQNKEVAEHHEKKLKKAVEAIEKRMPNQSPYDYVYQ